VASPFAARLPTKKENSEFFPSRAENTRFFPFMPTPLPLLMLFQRTFRSKSEEVSTNNGGGKREGGRRGEGMEREGGRVREGRKDE
jgi:hypothetical protein